MYINGIEQSVQKETFLLPIDFDKGVKTLQWGGGVFSTYSTGINGQSHGGKINLDPSSHQTQN